MTRRSIFGLGLGAGFFALIGEAVRLEFSGPEACSACSRSVQMHTKVTATVNRKKMVFCCPACALWMHRQSNQPVNIATLTDFTSGEALGPEEAYVVIGSTVNPCLGDDHMLVDPSKQPNRLDFDRCTPSMLVFRERDVARSFAAENSGTLTEFSRLVSGYVA